MSNEFWNVVDPLLIKVLDILQDITDFPIIRTSHVCAKAD